MAPVQAEDDGGDGDLPPGEIPLPPADDEDPLPEGRSSSGSSTKEGQGGKKKAGGSGMFGGLFGGGAKPADEL